MKKHTVLIKNALVVVTCADSGAEIKNGDIYIEGPEIKQVGANLAVKADEVVDASGCVVIPGLVNTHHHLYQTLTRNLPAVQDSKLFDWLIYLYEIWKHLTPNAVYTSAKTGLGELLLTGCTTAADHFYVFPNATSERLIDEEIRAARELGIRFNPCRGSMSRSKKDGGLPPDEVVQTESVIMKDCERVVKEYHDTAKFSMTRIALAPCSPFSVTTELLKMSAAAAKEWNVRLHTHLAETNDEDDFCMKMLGMRPLEYMDSVGWLEGGRSWFAHCVWLNEAESKRMAQTKTGVAHCPVSNLRLGSGIAPIRQYLNDGVPVGIAADGSASNDSSDLLGEVRMAMFVSRVKAGVSSMPARDAYRLACRGGAAVLGRDDIGSIEPGKAADIAIFDMNKLDYAGGMSDPAAALLFCGASHRAKYVFVNGKMVVKNEQLVNADEKALVCEHNAIAQGLYNAAKL